MPDLLLTDTATGAIEARYHLDGDVVFITGIAADIAREILESHARFLDGGDVAAFTYLHDFGWANGPLAIAPADDSSD